MIDWLIHISRPLPAHVADEASSLEESAIVRSFDQDAAEPKLGKIKSQSGLDHVTPDQLFLAGHGLFGDLAVMHDEFDIELQYLAASITFASGRLCDVAQPPAERDIGRFDAASSLAKWNGRRKVPTMVSIKFDRIWLRVIEFNACEITVLRFPVQALRDSRCVEVIAHGR